MFCPECGKENPDNARFCGNCRHQLPGASASEPGGRVVEVGAGEEGVSDLLKYGILVGTLFIPFVGLIMGIIYLAQGESEEKKSVGKLWLYGSIAVMFLYLLMSGGF